MRRRVPPQVPAQRIRIVPEQCRRTFEHPRHCGAGPSGLILALKSRSRSGARFKSRAAPYTSPPCPRASCDHKDNKAKKAQRIGDQHDARSVTDMFGSDLGRTITEQLAIVRNAAVIVSPSGCTPNAPAMAASGCPLFGLGCLSPSRCGIYQLS